MSLSLAEVEDVLHTLPGLTESFVQHTERSIELNSSIRKQGGDGFVKKMQRSGTYRVWLNTGSKFAEREAATLEEALQAAFAAIEMEFPFELVP